MDLTFTPEHDAFRAEARAWLRANVPTEPPRSFDTPEGWEQHREWERTLHDAGWVAVNWPRAYGGRDAGLIEWLIFEEEYWAAGAPGRVNQNGLFLLGPTMLEHGTDEQKQRWLSPCARADEIWCQGWSEPNAGSDLASLTSRAVQHGDDWVITGQKTWVSRGVSADWMFGLFRTDPEAARHRGLTFILVPMDARGVTVRPIRQLDGEPGFAEVFLDEVRVPAFNVLGPEGGGWQVAMATAGFERGVILRSPGRFLATANRLIEHYRAHRDRLPRALGDAVARAWADAEAYRLSTYWTVSRAMAGEAIGAEASMNKLFWSEMDRRMHELAMEMLGARGELIAAAGDVVDHGRWLDGFLFSLAGPIYAGTNEIQRTIVAERVLGLPRSR